MKLAKPLLQPPLIIEKTVATEFTLDDCHPLPTNTTTTKPMLVTGISVIPNQSIITDNDTVLQDVSVSDGSISCSTHSELEVVRGGSQREDLSYDDPSRNASAISGTFPQCTGVSQSILLFVH